MNTISNHSPLASYLASAGKAAASSSSKAEDKSASGDSIAELRRAATQLVARSEGGLLRALNGARGLQVASERAAENANLGGLGAPLQLPDVADLDRDEAGRLLAQVEKLIDSGLGDSLSFSGVNGAEQTDSLATYRDWLQARGGVSIYV